MQYGDFASVYDKLMCRDIKYHRLCDYIENLFIKHGCEPKKVCELACGTGNVTLCLEGRGYDMTGVDKSAAMLRAASNKLKRARLIRSDMSQFIAKEQFDAFLCLIDGINYIVTPKALERTFKNVHNALKEGGVFIFDISTRYKLKNIIGNETFIYSEYDIFYSWQNQYIEKYNLSDMLLNFFVRDENRYRRFEERHLQRGWSEKQLTYMLCRAGFSEIDVFDALTYDEPHPKSERIVFVCK